MSFTSVYFGIFLAIVFILYYLPVFRRHQVSLLVISSLVFYSWDQSKLLPLLLGSIVLTYVATIWAIRRDRTAAILGIAFNLALLIFFKYKFLFISAGQKVFTGNATVDFLLGLPLPIGISFFTFHNISLIVDYYKYGKDRPRPTLQQATLYILFFPQLVSGPITRSISFIPQIEIKKLSLVPWLQIFKLLILGFFFKLFVANNLAQITTQMDAPYMDALGRLDRIILVFVYSAQIYSDFFGYSTIALGLALLFGYRLPINFKLPYTASSFSDFWNRWHISLSSWLRTYLYIPLGGNQAGATRTYINLMIVMGLGGLWHGSSISYLFWGLLHGSFLAIERLVKNHIEKSNPQKISKYAFLTHVSYTLFVFICVSFAWIFFRFEHFPDVVRYAKGIINFPNNFSRRYLDYFLIFIYTSPVIIQHLVAPYLKLDKRNQLLQALVYGILLCLTLLERGSDTQFIYFRF